MSVVVTTKNEQRNIETCLRSILSQTYSQVEIIVVDNGSVDRTEEIARKYTDKFFNKGPERSAQRNYGMMVAAAGQYVMYVDADMILPPDLIDACVKRISKGDCVALHIPEVVLGKSFLSRVRRFERSFYDGTVIDAARFFSRDIFVYIGGFDEKLTGPEDWDIDKKLKQLGRIVLLNNVPAGFLGQWEFSNFILERGVDPVQNRATIFHNESDFQFWPYLRKKNYYSKGIEIYTKKWGCDDPDIRRQVGFFYRYFRIFLENGKWKKIIRNPLLALGMYGLRIAVGSVYLFKKILRVSS